MTADPADRYGAAAFAAALVTMTLTAIITWAFLPIWFINLFFFAVTAVVVLPTGAVLAMLSGRNGRIGRGMLIGWLATPLTLAMLSGLFLYVVLTGW